MFTKIASAWAGYVAELVAHLTSSPIVRDPADGLRALMKAGRWFPSGRDAGALVTGGPMGAASCAEGPCAEPAPYASAGGYRA